VTTCKSGAYGCVCCRRFGVLASCVPMSRCTRGRSHNWNLILAVACAVLATVYENAAHMKGPYPGWDKDMQFVASHDFFKSDHRTMVPCGNQFEVSPSPAIMSS